MSWEQDEGEEFEHVNVVAPDGTPGVASFPKASKLPLPDGLLGILFDRQGDDDGGFVCTDCIKDDDNTDDETKCTPILDYDTWFHGAVCIRCKEHVAGGPKPRRRR
jgi:hypothetical protein